MVVQLVLHFVFEEDKLKTTPVAVKGLIYLQQRRRQSQRSLTDGHLTRLRRASDRVVGGYLVPQQVLLVAHRVSVHLQTEDAQQEARVCVEAGEVPKDVRVEGGAKRAHLQITPGSEGLGAGPVLGPRGGPGTSPTLTWQT